jgi:hypothetical protein
VEFRFPESGKTVELDDRIVGWATAHQSSMMDAHELTSLAAALAAYDWRDGEFVVEIGAYLGHTTVFMGKVLRRLGKCVSILSIDPFERFQPNPLNPQGDYSAYVASVVANQMEQVCLPLACCSSDAAGVVADNVGVLIIDGDHTYAAVAADLRLYAPKVRPGGFLFIDDYGPAYPGVMQAVDEVLAGSLRFTLHEKSYFVVVERTR